MDHACFTPRNSSNSNLSPSQVVVGDSNGEDDGSMRGGRWSRAMVVAGRGNNSTTM